MPGGGYSLHKSLRLCPGKSRNFSIVGAEITLLVREQGGSKDEGLCSWRRCNTPPLLSTNTPLHPANAATSVSPRVLRLPFGFCLFFEEGLAVQHRMSYLTSLSHFSSKTIYISSSPSPSQTAQASNISHLGGSKSLLTGLCAHLYPCPIPSPPQPQASLQHAIFVIPSNFLKTLPLFPLFL